VNILAVLQPRTLAWPDYIALIIYFVLNLGVGWWCARRKRANSQDFFLGGGRVVWWAAAISFFATGTSSISFMALPAKTFQTDWMVFGSGPAQALAGVVVGLVFVGLLRRLNLTTVYGYLERRFDWRVRLLGAGLSVLLKICGRMAVVMLLPALALSTVTGMNVYLSIALMGGVTTVYALEGGFEAVIWTDVLQVFVMVGGVVVALFYISSGVSGGLPAIIQTSEAAGKFNMVSWSADWSQPTVWVFIGMFLGTIFTQVADQPLMQRMLATANVAEARRTVVLGNAVGLVSSVVFFFIGTALWAFYQEHPDRLDSALPRDAIFPYFIANELPRGVVGIIIAGLFAAAMGALSSVINATASIVVSDFQGTLRPNASEAQRLWLARFSTILCGVVATLMAAFLAYRNVSSLWDEFLKLIALIGGGFPGVFALGLLSRRANASGVIIGALASIVITWWVQNFTTINIFLHGFIAIGSCMVVGYVCSFFFAARSEKKDQTGLTLWGE
jgi:solute:Na+ symporter, SSS family